MQSPTRSNSNLSTNQFLKYIYLILSFFFPCSKTQYIHCLKSLSGFLGFVILQLHEMTSMSATHPMILELPISKLPGKCHVPILRHASAPESRQCHLYLYTRRASSSATTDSPSLPSTGYGPTEPGHGPIPETDKDYCMTWLLCTKSKSSLLWKENLEQNNFQGCSDPVHKTYWNISQS